MGPIPLLLGCCSTTVPAWLGTRPLLLLLLLLLLPPPKLPFWPRAACMRCPLFSCSSGQEEKRGEPLVQFSRPLARFSSSLKKLESCLSVPQRLLAVAGAAPLP